MGLTEAEAVRRLADTGPNEVAARKPVRLHRRVLAQLTDPLIMMLLGAVVLTLAIGDHPDAIVIGMVVLVNTTVGVAQEIRADDAVSALSALTAPHARVRRDGAVRDLAAAAIVPGDILPDVAPAGGTRSGRWPQCVAAGAKLPSGHDSSAEWSSSATSPCG